MDEPGRPDIPEPDDNVSVREWAKALIFVVVVGAAAIGFVMARHASELAERGPEAFPD
jgi:hypothetical protein